MQEVPAVLALVLLILDLVLKTKEREMSELKGQVMGLCSTAWMVPVELTSTILVLIASFLEIKHNLLIP